MSRLTDEQLKAAYNAPNKGHLASLRAVADAAVAAYVADKSECLGREKCLALANAVLSDMDCHPTFVKAMATDAGPFGYLIRDKHCGSEDFTREKPEYCNQDQQIIALYTHPLPDASKTDVPDGYTPVLTSTLLWLLGENGEFACPEKFLFRGKEPPYFWRKQLRAAMLAAQKEPHL